MIVWAQSSQRATCPPRAAVRQLSIALITFIWGRLTWPRLASRQAAPWSRKISATSRAERAMTPVRSGRGLDGLRLWRSQPIERAHDRAQDIRGDLGVARRRVELGVPEQHLDHAHIDGALQEMRREGVPQRMRGDPRAQARCFRRHVADTLQL